MGLSESLGLYKCSVFILGFACPDTDNELEEAVASSRGRQLPRDGFVRCSELIVSTSVLFYIRLQVHKCTDDNDALDPL